MISEQTKQRIRDLVARYPVARSAVMPALSITQQEVCTSISCYLRNCHALAGHLENRPGIKRGETSATHYRVSRVLWHRSYLAGQ